MSEIRADRRLFLASLSLANLWYLPVWAHLLPSALGGENLYYYASLPPRVHYAFLPLNVLLLAGVFYAVSSSLKRTPLSECGFLISLLIPINGLRIQFGALSLKVLLSVLGKAGLLLVGVGLGAFGVWLLTKHRKRAMSVATSILVMGAAFVPVSFGQSLWCLIVWDTPAESGAALTIETGSQQAKHRIVWLIFDEADQELIFDARPQGILLPTIDSFAAEGVLGTRVESPGPATAYSIPAYSTGRQVVSAMPVARDRMMIRFAGAGDYVEWSKTPTLFSSLAATGVNVAVSGWHHPYCRQFATLLAYCRDHLSPPQLVGQGVSAIISQWQRLWQSFPLVYRLSDRILEHSRQRKRDLQSIHRTAMKLVTDAAYEFVWVHYPVPHLPGIWNAQSDSWVTDRHGIYAGNLELMDLLLGELLIALETSDVADRTDVVLLSDHPYRSKAGKDNRVPFVIRLGGERRGERFEGSLNARVAHDYVLDRFAGKILDKASLIEWLEEKAHPGRSH